jgi:steroid delta-isomerase-like uncharacterized protein
MASKRVRRRLTARLTLDVRCNRALIISKKYPEAHMNAEEMKKHVRRHYEEVLSRKRIELIDELYAEQIQVGDSGSVPREQFKQLAQLSITAFPDLSASVKDQIAEGHKVVTRWTATGTQSGPFMNIAPTGKKVTITAIHIHQIAEGRIAALWEEIDLFGLYQQLGIRIEP